MGCDEFTIIPALSLTLTLRLMIFGVIVMDSGLVTFFCVVAIATQLQ